MANQQTIDQLNDLIRMNVDAEAGFHSAAETIKNSELETLFDGYAKQHANFRADLEVECKRLGGQLASDGTMGGAMHRGWMDLKSVLSGHSASSVLASCLDAEESAEIRYTNAADANPTGQTHVLLEKQRLQVKQFMTRLARLVGETKDGVDFQKNE